MLADVAEDVGLDPEEVGEAVEDEDIRSIPTFVYGEHAARGAIPPSQFERLVEGV